MKIQSSLFALLALLTLPGLSARAENLQCYFTNPFITFVYNEADHQLSKSVYGENNGKWTHTPDVSLVEIAGSHPTSFALVQADGTEIMSLIRNGNGSDGMSDRIYLYDANFDKWFGGCDPIEKSAPNP